MILLFKRVETAEKLFIHPAQFSNSSKFVVINRVSDEITMESKLCHFATTSTFVNNFRSVLI